VLTSPSIPPFPVLVVRAERDPTKRIVITGMGIASVFGNEISTFYDSCVFFFFLPSPRGRRRAYRSHSWEQDLPCAAASHTAHYAHAARLGLAARPEYRPSTAVH